MSGSTEHKVYHSHAKTYWIIFVVLAVLTVAELFIPESPMPYAAKAFSLVFLALAKAVLVAYYYMHLNEEKGWLRFIAAIPVSAFIYAVVVILESMYR